MLIFILSLTVLIIVRTIKNNYRTSILVKDESKFKIIINLLVRFFFKELRTLIYYYIGLVGMYVLVERMYVYKIAPANIEPVKDIFKQIHEISGNEFVIGMFLVLLVLYLTLLLPFKIIRLYNLIIEKTKSSDILQSFIMNNVKKLDNKLTNKK